MGFNTRIFFLLGFFNFGKRDLIDCGGHKRETCKKCGKIKEWCSGDCQWDHTDSTCKDKRRKIGT